MFRIAKSEESESVRRRKFPSGGDWVSRDRQANMAVSSATKTDALFAHTVSCYGSSYRIRVPSFVIRSGATG